MHVTNVIQSRGLSPNLRELFDETETVRTAVLVRDSISKDTPAF